MRNIRAIVSALLTQRLDGGMAKPSLLVLIQAAVVVTPALVRPRPGLEHTVVVPAIAPVGGLTLPPVVVIHGLVTLSPLEGAFHGDICSTDPVVLITGQVMVNGEIHFLGFQLGQKSTMTPAVLLRLVPVHVVRG